MTYVSSSRFAHPPSFSRIFTTEPCILYLNFSFSFLHPFLFPYHVLPVCRSRIQTPSTSERFSEYLPPAASPASQPKQMQRTRGRRLCAIVVSRLLFLGNFTSFTNYPLRAYAVQKWRCSPDIAALTGKEGDGAREWRRCRLIFSHRINPAPASRRGLILHVAEDLVCQG